MTRGEVDQGLGLLDVCPGRFVRCHGVVVWCSSQVVTSVLASPVGSCGLQLAGVGWCGW